MGTIPEGYGLAQAINYISAQIDQGTTYDITVRDNEFLDPQTVMTLGQNVTVYLHSPSADDVKTVTLNSNGTLFTVDNSITFKLENITLKGRTSNNAPLVKVMLGGTLVMEAGAAITGNTNSGDGGGIYVDRGKVTMNDGSVSGNKAANGGGVFVTGNDALFTLVSGEIAANTATNDGGGLHIISNGKGLMNGGIIKGNSATRRGGGISVYTLAEFIKTSATGSTTSGVIYGSTGNTDLINTASAGSAISYLTSGSYGGLGPVRNRMLGALDEITTANLNEGWD
jgi:hypothetical protein